MNKQSLRKTWVIISLLAALGLSLGAGQPRLGAGRLGVHECERNPGAERPTL